MMLGFDAQDAPFGGGLTFFPPGSDHRPTNGFRRSPRVLRIADPEGVLVGKLLMPWASDERSVP
jgi:hypothetical protein